MAKPEISASDLPLADTPTEQAPEEWLATAARAVDKAIDQLVTDFMAHPYTHRVEHSFHIELYDLLNQEAALKGRVTIGKGPFETQLIHKEWPSVEATSFRVDGKLTRQSYDLGILSPASLKEADLATFTAGKIPAPIAVELGLDYSLRHLLRDLDKFARNKVAHPYIVHFSRKRTRKSAEVEDAILNAPADVRTAYVHFDDRTFVYRCKRLGEKSVTVSRFGQPGIAG